MRSIMLATAAAAFAIAAPAYADHHASGDHSAGHGASDGTDHSADHGSKDHAMNMPLMEVLASETRADDFARDKYRNPMETLGFFRVEQQHTVVEYAPGGGWYTRVLAPYLAGSGQYIAVDGDTDQRSFRDEEAEAQSRSWPARFPAIAAGWTGVDAANIMAFESDELPEGVAGKVDRVLIFRSMHGLLNSNRADSELRNIRAMLADDGLVGVVQHRAKADQPYEMAMGTRGYLRQDDVIALFTAFGFELVDASEVNANAADSADWEGGVWTLPPVLRYGDQDRDKYTAVGESDRMTLLFKKAD